MYVAGSVEMDPTPPMSFYVSRSGACSSMVEPPAHNRSVPGSSPGRPRLLSLPIYFPHPFDFPNRNHPWLAPKVGDNMKEVLRKVLELHFQDQKIIKLREKLEKIPFIKEELERRMNEKRQAFQENTNLYQELEKQRLVAERDSDHSRARIQTLESQLPLIKTEREFEASTKEITESKRNIKALEEKLIQLMGQLEDGKTIKDTLEVPLQDAEIAFGHDQTNLDEEARNFSKEIADLERKREELLAVVDKKLLVTYQKTLKVRREAMVSLESGVCRGCHMKVPPQLFIEIHKALTVHSCPSCHRLLYLPEWFPDVSA